MNPLEPSGPPTPPAIPAEYKQKLAICYIRQSTLDQVKHNTGSTGTQRALADRALWYGWPPQQITVIDEDLGLSGTASDQRTGFQRLLAMMERGQVGLVLVRDASRISRNRFDSARFWRMAMLADVLVEVSGRLRHPATNKATDRFGLEVESLLAWYENEYKTEMLQAAKVAKIGQRRAVTAPPIGYVKAAPGEWEKGPEPAVCSVIRQMIDAYLQFASLRKARRHLHAQGVRFPRRVRGRIEWATLTDGRLHRVLTNPNYTPDYCFRRRRTVLQASGKTLEHLRARDEWQVIEGHHEGYMTREEFDRIQSMLRQRRFIRQPFPGKGAGLLQGLLFCGRCGRWMRTLYDGRDAADPSNRPARYRCAPRDTLGTEQHRLSCPAAGIDQVVVRAVLGALAPPGMTDALQAIRDDLQQHEATELARRRHLHRAEERVHDLKRRYFDVDPARHMLKLELEQDLEAALQDLWRLRQPILEEPRSRTVTEADAVELLRPAADLDAVWNAPTTTNEERKRILSTAITKIVLHDNNTNALEIIWAGGLVERQPLPRGPGGTKLVTQIESVRRIHQMLIESRSQREILHALQSQGGDVEWTPYRLTAAIKRLRLGVWGQAVPPLPPGTRRGRKLELAVIQFFADRRKTGTAFGQIAGELNGLGFRTPLGHAFTESSACTIYRGLQQDPGLADLFAFDDPPGSRGKASQSTSSGRRCRRLRAQSEQPE